jgi:hypothetical protein
MWHLFRQPELAKPRLPKAAMAAETRRRVVGIASYALAAVVGCLVSPAIAVCIFILVVGFYAWTSQGVFIFGRASARSGLGACASTTRTGNERFAGWTFTPREGWWAVFCRIADRVSGIGWAIIRFESKDRSVASKDR